MRLFITGATGFIGSHLVRRLAGANHEVSCLVRGSSKIAALKELGANLVTGDITDKDSLLAGVGGHDLIIDLANLYSFWEPDRSLFRAVNVDGTRNVMEAALERGVSKVVHVSTAGIYGKPADCPFTEESTEGPTRPSEYFRTKYEGDQIAWELYRTRGLPLVMIYPCAVLGPGDDKATGRYIQDFVKRRLPARIYEKAVMTFVHVADVVDAIVRAAEKENNIGERYLVGKHQLTWGEFNRLISEISGVPLPRLSLPGFLVMLNASVLTWLADITKRPPMWGMATDQMKTVKEGFVVDGSKAERELGICYTQIEDALREAIETSQ